MRSCHVLVVLAALLLAACGTESSGPKYAGFEAKGIKAVEPSQAGQEIGQRLEAVKGRKPEATKDEAPPVPAATRFFRLTEAFEGTGFLPQSLKHEVAEEVVAGKVPYVKVTSYEGKPEVAYIFDSFNNETNRVQYVWDDRYNVIAGEYQNRTGAMLKKYLFCPREEGRIDVHELDSFRVHKAYTQRVVLGENRITVSYLDGHDPRGGLPLWPECKELDPIADQARGYESPWGTAKMEFVFSGKGELLVAARYNAAGQLDSDYQGISKRELKWDDAGQLLEELDYDDATAIYRVIYTRANGLLAERKILSPEGAPRADYLGVATYGYAYDTAGRVETETRTGADGQVLGSVKFAYNRKGYVTEELHLDGTGAIQRSLVHQYDKKGLRTELAVFRGAAADAVRMLDENRVAVYRWAYDKEGQLLVQSHHGVDEVDTPEGRSFRL
ncbi:MAG: hypothetical protein FJ098_07530, partial [Deltaproteobacteria bacterium]|nr:hypothetical protein [Deltaproteobacteria bacterium]